jgi:predicted P-loop ATPase
MSTLIPFPAPDAEEHASAETERKRRLFAWADHVLEEIGLVAKIAAAANVLDLSKISFDPDSVEVALAIRDVLHPTNGQRENCFVGMREGTLKRLLKTRFAELRRDREAALQRGHGAASSRASTTTSNWTDDLKLDDKGAVRPLLTNLIQFLRNHPKWEGVLGFDEFNVKVVIRKRPPWGDEPPDTPWTDNHDALTRVWFQGEEIFATQGDVGRAVQVAARHNPFHPVRDYFDALVWDGTPRLDTVLSTYFHAEDSPYTRAIGPRFLISGVARIYKPGCKVDHMWVLEGPQGRQKSEALRTLAIRDDWFTDQLSAIKSKDASVEMAGAFLIEIPEMDALTRASSNTGKGFLTRRFDRYRPPYGKHTVNLPRQCVFAGTVNPPANGYLKDSTGARRFWPVACRGLIDRDGIEHDRDQLWAEACVRFKAGATWWLETPQLEALAAVEQAARFQVDVWQERVAKWIGRRRDVSISEVLAHALGLASAQEQSHRAEMRVAAILTRLGFTKVRARKGRQREYRYQREN